MKGSENRARRGPIGWGITDATRGWKNIIAAGRKLQMIATSRRKTAARWESIFRVVTRWTNSIVISASKIRMTKARRKIG